MSTRPLVVSAAVLTVAGELEVLLGSAGDDGGRLVSALAVPAMTLPLAWSGRAPLPALAGVALALLVQAALGGFLVGASVTTIAVLVLALYAAGRRSSGAWAFAGAAGLAAVVAATRVAFDADAQEPRQALLTFAAVACPLFVGRWVRGQDLLRRELADGVARRRRDRERDARQAADEERERIAADLQVAVAAGLQAITDHAEVLPDVLRAGDRVSARERLAAIAGTARAALADVRRVLGVLRHDGEAPRLAPPGAGGSPEPTGPAGAAPASPVAPASRRRLRAVAVPGGVADAALAGAVLTVGAIELAISGPRGAAFTAVALAAPLLWRRRRPVVAAAGVLAAITVQSLLVDLDSFPLADMLAMVIATYAVGAYADRGAGVLGLLLAATGAVAHAAVFYPEGVVAALLGGVGLPWTVGRLVRGKRGLLAVEREKGLAVERSRARDAAAAVTSERMRVARELHDAVAHNLSVIAIQAGGAEAIVERDRVRAAEIAALIGSVAREALAELARLAELPTADAAPGLADVERLIEPARAAGLDVELRVDDRARTLPAGIDLAAYRIVQEALANTAKHAQADRAWIVVRCPGRAVELEIADDGHGPKGRGPAREGGHGLIGMRERVALYGGSLDLGRHPGGGFLVRARMPIEGA